MNAGATGCYRFAQTDEPSGLELPWGIELLADSLTGWGSETEAFRARTWLTATEPADHPFGYWIPVGTDSIRIGHPGGGGFDLVLGLGPDGLTGRRRAAGDAMIPGATTGQPAIQPVRAIRIPCPPGGRR